MSISFFRLGIGPGLEKTVLSFDLRGLYLSLYGYLSDPGPGFNNLFHSMAGGLGGNIYGTVILCLSPLDLIFSFVPLRSIPTVLYFMILFKIGLCGVSACFYLSHNDRTGLSAPVAVLFSCCYALMSY
ncbi:MAG: YfhO family protein, partial [Lachnospiraceae bacterium]|nr:YfhO family protein [Lachnospiraceae bacterium]